MAGSGLTGFLQNFGGGELIVILLVALVVLGPDRLPEMARGAGRMLHRFRTMTESLSSDVREVIDDPAMQPLRELGELAARPRQKLAEYALEAEAEERARKERASLAADDPPAAEPGPATYPGPVADPVADAGDDAGEDADASPDADPVDPAAADPVPDPVADVVAAAVADPVPDPMEDAATSPDPEPV